MIIEKKKISDLKPAPYNPRKSSDKQEANLKKSLEKFGVVEPIVFNKQTGHIVGGHFRIRELKKLGYKEVDCVIVDLNEDDEKELNIRLNANTGDWDWDTLANEWDVQDLKDWGLEMPADWGVEPEPEDDDKYTKKLEAPKYKITGEKPEAEELTDDTRYNELIGEIDAADIPEEDKEFLKKAAVRHIVFNYTKIAEYYAHASKEVQELMENSALVIIDYNKAIELGYVQLSKQILDQYSEEYGNEE